MIIVSRTQFHIIVLINVLNVKAVVATFNQEKALVRAFSVITNLRMDLFEALLTIHWVSTAAAAPLCSASSLPAAGRAWPSCGGELRSYPHPYQALPRIISTLGTISTLSTKDNIY